MAKKQVKQIEEVKSEEECPNNSEEEIKVVKKSSKKSSKEPKLQVEMYELPKMKSSKKVVENISDEKPKKKKIVKVNAWIDYMKDYNAKNNTTGFSAASSSWKKMKEEKIEKEAKKSKKSKK